MSKSNKLIDLYLLQRETSPDECYTDAEILHEFMTFFSAGMDTTGHLLTMTVYYLTKNPEILVKLKEEISKVYGENLSEDFTFENLNKLDYMHAVFRETLRFANPAPFIFWR